MTDEVVFEAPGPRPSRASVIVVGAAPQIDDALPPYVFAFRVTATMAEPAPYPLAALVLDARSLDLDALARAREHAWLEGIPTMVLLSDYADADAVATLLAADDVVRTAAPFGELRRRLAMLIAWGRARIAADFAARRLAQSAAALVDRQEFAHAILDGVDVGILTTDPNGSVTFVNRTAAVAIGSVEHNLGRDVREVLRLETSPGALLQGGSRVVIEHAFADEQGTDLDLELTVSRPRGPTHDAVGFFFIFRDLGVDKQREVERRRLERLAAMGTMVAGFAHEVRNPLAALRSLVESLGEDFAELDLKMPQVGRMIDVLERVERLVRTSLQFGRPDPPRRAQHRPWVVVSQALSSIGPRARELGGHVRIEVEPDLPDVVVDEGQVVQVLVILLDNALDATGSALRVLMRAGLAPPLETSAGCRKSNAPPPPPDVEIEVLDDGPGVPPEIIHRIFDPFFTTKPAGTGLGLSIAQQLVNENGGRLEVVSGRGATSFSIRLPSAECRRPSVKPLPSPRLPRGSIA